jgi:carbamoyltransferase
MLIWADVAASRRRSLSDTDAVLAGTDKVNASRPEIPAVTHVDYSARL